MTRDELLRETDRFMEAWARHDLDAAMALMADDAVYEDLQGNVHRGRSAVRAAFEPEFSGEYGDIQFDREDTFADEIAQRVLVRWRCTFEWRGARRAWRGLDALRFDNGLVIEKLTYGKALRPAYERE